MNKLGPETTKVLCDLSKSLLTTGFWTIRSMCGDPKIIMIEGNTVGARVSVTLLAHAWDMECCGSSCYGPGHHIVEFLTMDQIKKLGFRPPSI